MTTKCWIALNFLLLLCVLSLVTPSIEAQSISGFSTVGVSRLPSPRRGVITPSVVSAYSDTEEDYTASLYYNVANQSATFYEGDQSPVSTGSAQGNPSATSSYTYQNGMSVVAGLYSEVTDHLVQFFYIQGGSYFDPYDLSGSDTDCDPDTVCGDYNSGYWLYVYAALYVVEAQAIIGQSVSTTNVSAGAIGGGIESVMYQAFIPPDYVSGPPGSCTPNIYAGDNRGLSPGGGSYRALQQIAVGVNGIVSASTPAQATGYTFRFSPAVLQNNLIPPSAYNYGYIGKCSSNGIDAYGHASTNTFTPPQVSYNGQNPTIVLKGNTSNPVPLFSFAIDWNFTVTLSAAQQGYLNASGTYNHDCYPAHELSVGNVDVYSWVNPANDIVTLTACLAGAGQKTGTFSQLIPVF